MANVSQVAARRSCHSRPRSCRVYGNRRRQRFCPGLSRWRPAAARVWRRFGGGVRRSRSSRNSTGRRQAAELRGAACRTGIRRTQGAGRRGRGGRGGFGPPMGPVEPGARVSRSDVKTVPATVPFYDLATLRTIFFDFADTDWEDQTDGVQGNRRRSSSDPDRRRPELPGRGLHVPRCLVVHDGSRRAKAFPERHARQRPTGIRTSTGTARSTCSTRTKTRRSFTRCCSCRPRVTTCRRPRPTSCAWSSTARTGASTSTSNR